MSAHFYDCAQRFTPSPCEIPARLRDGTTRVEGGVRGDLRLAMVNPAGDGEYA